MVGSNPAFPAADFRAGIRAAAKMAFPNAVEVQPIFHWDAVQTVPNASATGRPWRFDGTVTPTVDGVIDDLVVENVIAVVDKIETAQETASMGVFRGSRMTLTVLDVDYKDIVEHGGGRFADSVMVGATEYRINEIPKPDALFSVDVWTIYAYSPSIAKPA